MKICGEKGEKEEKEEKEEEIDGGGGDYFS